MKIEYVTVRSRLTGRLGRARRCFLAWGRGEIKDVRRVLYVPLQDDPFRENEVPENIASLEEVNVL